jgi:class 3 adenylate cyclase
MADWLRRLELAQYIPAFAENAIDWAVLPRLNADDLKDIGVVAVGHRRRLLDAIAALAESPPPAALPPSAAMSSSAPDRGAERRQLTVMFCDLLGSTALSARLDSEDLREVIGAYHAVVAAEVGRFGGFVAKYMGDGVLTYFCYPEAHEDDAERAVRTGLALAERVGQLRTAARLEARVGIATGLVVVGDLIGTGEAQERGVVGETPNLAARMQELAPPSGVVIAEGTRRLIGDLFELRDLGAVAVKGFAAAVPVWQAVRPSAVESRFEALRAGALTPLVGREEELELLLRRWQRAKACDGQVVLLSGEPGIGKSRLTAALRERLEGEPHIRLRYFCSPHHRDSALHPFTARLERAADFRREDTAEARLDKLEALLAPAAPSPEELALLAELLLLPITRYPALQLSPQRKKQRTFAALLRQLGDLARRQPVLMVFEDLHWIDPSSRELLDLIIARVTAGLPVLLVLTFRPEFRAPWSGLPQVTALTLHRLDPRTGAAMVERIAGNRKLPDALAAEIVERADGVLLFVEELTRAIIEAGPGGETHRSPSGDGRNHVSPRRARPREGAFRSRRDRNRGDDAVSDHKAPDRVRSPRWLRQHACSYDLAPGLPGPGAAYSRRDAVMVAGAGAPVQHRFCRALCGWVLCARWRAAACPPVRRRRDEPFRRTRVLPVCRRGSDRTGLGGDGPGRERNSDRRNRPRVGCHSRNRDGHLAAMGPGQIRGNVPGNGTYRGRA